MARSVALDRAYRKTSNYNMRQGDCDYLLRATAWVRVTDGGGQKSREWAFMEGFEEEMEMGCMRAGSTELVAPALAPAAARAARAEAKLAARLSLRGSAGCCC